MLKLAVLSLVFLAVFGQYAWAVDEIIVGGWNVENLGRPNQRENSGKGVPQQPEVIATYIRSSGVHVLALEEICAEKNGGTRQQNKTLDDVVKILSSDSRADWKYRLFRGPKSKAVTRLTGVMWNHEIVKPVGDPIPLELPADSFRRKGKPTAIKFSAGARKTDFVIIPVHMKSNRRQKGESADESKKSSAEQRAKEAKYIIEALDDLRRTFSDQDIVIIGDVNALSHSEEAVMIFVKAGFRDLNEQDLVTYISKKYPTSPLDRAFVPSNQPEFYDSKMEGYKPRNLSPEEFRQKLSDHYMIKFTVKVMDDDD